MCVVSASYLDCEEDSSSDLDLCVIFQSFVYVSIISLPASWIMTRASLIGGLDSTFGCREPVIYILRNTICLPYTLTYLAGYHGIIMVFKKAFGVFTPRHHKAGKLVELKLLGG